jgi:hypothetical protein
MRPDAAGTLLEVRGAGPRDTILPFSSSEIAYMGAMADPRTWLLAADMKDYVGRESPLYSRQATFRVLPSRGRVHAPHLPQTRGPEPHGCTQDQQLVYEIALLANGQEANHR